MSRGGAPGEVRRAVVLGASGHAGSAIVRELLRRGAAVTAASRRRSLPRSLEGLDVSPARGDADDPGALEAWVDGHDLVVDAAAPYPLWLFRPSSRAEADPLGYARARTRRLLGAVKRHGARLAVVGSFTSLPHPGSARGDVEPELLRQAHPYFEVKDTIESMVLSAADRGLPALVVNPTAFLGPWDHKDPSLCFLPRVLRGDLPVTASRVVNVIDVRDVAAALVQAVICGRFGERIPLAGHNVSISALAQRACSMVGVEPPALVGSTRLGAALSYCMEAVWGAAGRRPPVPALAMLLVRYSYPMRPSRAQMELGAAPRPLSSTLRAAIRWYSSIGYL